MSRYAKQLDSYSCGPIAVANAFKWAGKKCPWAKNRKWLKKACKTSVKKGTYIRNVEKVLRKDFKLFHICGPTIKDIELALSLGELVLISNTWPKKKNMPDEGHIFLVDKKTAQGFNCINIFGESSVEIIRKQFLHIISRRRKLCLVGLEKRK